jgi:hypothetical protein
LPQKYLDDLDCLIRGAGEFVPMNAAPVILTGEYARRTFCFNCHTGNWKVSGLIDFGNVMTGWGEYDLFWPQRLHDGGNTTARSQTVARLRMFRSGYRRDYDKAPFDPDVASPHQRPCSAHLY